jgi:hypothetical protein
VSRPPLCVAFHPARPTTVDGSAMLVPGQNNAPPKACEPTAEHTAGARPFLVCVCELGFGGNINASA